MKLGTLLLRNAAISLTQLEAALRAQVLYGGKLGTNLVELGFVELDQLAEYLGEMSQLPVATRPMLDAIAPEALALLDSATCERLGVMPLGVAPPPDAALQLAMIDPSDVAALDEVARRTGLLLAPHVVPELRLLYYLEKAYGLPRKARFVRAGTRRAPGASGPYDDRRRAQPAGGIVLPPSVRLEPRRRARSMPPADVPSELPGSEDPTPLPRLGWALACDRLDHAVQRDQIGELFCDFGIGRFDAVVVFLVRDGNALGWHGRLHLATPKVAFDQISLPLGPASAFQIAHDGLRVHHGPAAAIRPVETALWEALGTPAPTTFAVAPIVVKQRVVNLVYAHGAGGARVPETDVAELAELCVRASDAYIRLIRKSKS